MDWISKLERKLGKFAIPNLMFYIIGLYAVGYVLHFLNPNFYYQYLSLDAYAILHGQVWRVITFLVQPPSTSIIFGLIMLYFYYRIGRSLEAAWGTFRFNMYFFCGILLHVIAAIVTYLIFGISLPMETYYLNFSLFFAFAVLNPEAQIWLYGVIPLKAKYLAYIDGAYFAWGILQAFLPAYGGHRIYGMYYKAQALAAAVSLLNFAIFYFSSRHFMPYSPGSIKRKRQFKKSVAAAKPKPSDKFGGTQHRCAVCGRTELDDPNLEFRYCSKCTGNYEYCQDHLFTHEHIK